MATYLSPHGNILDAFNQLGNGNAGLFSDHADSPTPDPSDPDYEKILPDWIDNIDRQSRQNRQDMINQYVHMEFDALSGQDGTFDEKGNFINVSVKNASAMTKSFQQAAGIAPALHRTAEGHHHPWGWTYDSEEDFKKAYENALKYGGQAAADKIPTNWHYDYKHSRGYFNDVNDLLKKMGISDNNIWGT